MTTLLTRVEAVLAEIDAILTEEQMPVRGYATRLVMGAQQLCVVRDDERARLSRIAALASESDCCERGAYVHR